ncbi:L-asparaginase 2 [bacterium]|nr:L-asparaginase 2 [bacterium]|tara:strand:- start:341 stop:1393 length:1053 start_codon:yes stop_codon:yes gene_type:complete
MKLKHVIALYIIASLLFCKPLVAELKTIQLITMGGAITGTQKDALSGKFKLSSRSAETLVAGNIEILELADIKFKELFNIPSQEITTEHWIKLAKEVDKAVNNITNDAVIITHGTDTLEETAYFLNLTIKTKKPIIITGAIRAALHPSSDSTQNLIDSIRVATHPNASNKGVLVVANGKIISARQIQKNYNHSLDALESSEIGILGYVHNEIIDFHTASIKKHTLYSEFDIKTIEDLPTVDIAYAYSGGLSANLKNKVNGLIIAGVGSGNISKKNIAILKKLQKNNIQIVRSTRNIGAPLYSTIGSEINDKYLEFVSSNNLSPQKARILLMLALHKTKDPNKIRSYFENH